MTTANPSHTLSRRLLVTGIALFVAATLIAALVAGPRPPAAFAHTLCLLLVALAAYTWMLFPLGYSGVFAGLVGLLTAWAWAAYQTQDAGQRFWTVLVSLGGLTAVAVVQRGRRGGKQHRLVQALDDLEEERTVKDQAVQAASQAREALRRKLARYTQLQSIAEELSNLTDLHAIARLAVERTFALIGKSDVCLLFLVDRERQELGLFASRKQDRLEAIRAKHGDQFDRYVLRTHRPLLVNDVRRDFRFTVSLSQERPISSVIACPLILNQSAEGVLRLDSAQAGAYTQDDLRFLDILLDLVATAITNANLFSQTQRLAITDGLTELSLRRPFLEQLARELIRAGRSKEPLSVLMLDVDHFKQFNDSFGHTAGDLVLKGVAEVLRAVVPPDGVSARYGGEEFAVLLPRTPGPEAKELAEKIRRMVERQEPVGGRGTGRPVTVSIGAASFPGDAKSDLELIRVADQRLYQAKRAGRNMVCA